MSDDSDNFYSLEISFNFGESNQNTEIYHYLIKEEKEFNASLYKWLNGECSLEVFESPERETVQVTLPKILGPKSIIRTSVSINPDNFDD